jgi:hypothetical protein
LWISPRAARPGFAPGLFPPGSDPWRVGTGDALFSVSPTPSVFDFEPAHHTSGRTAIRSTTPRLNWSSRRQSSKQDAPKRNDYFFFAFRFFAAFFAFFAFFAMLSS